MKNSIKLLFVALSLLMVGVVFWHLQSPPGAIQKADKAGCLPRVGETGEQSANVPQGSRACDDVRSSSQTHAPETLMTDIRFYQFDGTQTQWTLNGTHAQREGEDDVVIYQPNLILYKDSGQEVSVTSVKGFMDSRSQSMVFAGKVVVKNGTQRLSTDILRFDPGKRILYTDQEFLLVDGRVRLEGVGLTFYQDTKKWVVSHKVRVQSLS